MSNKEIFSKIKTLQFPKEIKPLLDLLDKHVDRIDYVKDHVGLRDFLFIAEENANEFEFQTFCYFDVPINLDNDDENFLTLNQMMIYEPKEVFQSVKDFFENTDRILYIGIGFKQSVLKQSDMFLVHDLLEKKEAKTAFEALSKVRKFPSWYKAKFPKDIHEQLRSRKILEKADTILLQKRKEDLLQLIDKALTENDSEKFLLYSSQLATISNDLEKRKNDSEKGKLKTNE